MSQHKRCLLIGIVLIFSLFLTSCGSSDISTSYVPEPVIHDDVKFSEFPFYLPDAGEFKTLKQTFVSNMEAATSAKEQIALIADYDRECRRYADMRAIAAIRFNQNVTDKKAQADYEYFDQFYEDVAEDDNKADRAIAESRYVKELESYFGKKAIDMYRDYVREFDPAQNELRSKMNELDNQYMQLLSNYTDGVNMYEYEFTKEADSIFTEMLSIRKNMAELAGYNSFSEYQYSKRSIKLSDVEAYIANVKKTVLPVYQKLAAAGRGSFKRCPPSNWIRFIPKTLEDERELSMQVLRTTLNEMNPLIDYLERNEMLDIMPRENKAILAANIPLYGVQTPFVILTAPNAYEIFHEFGHALEIFEWPKIDLSERFASTPLSLEVSSMCMEVLATTQYELLYGDTAANARMRTIYGLTSELLMNTMRSEFELALYAKPEMTQAERDALFNELLEEYRISRFVWEKMHHYFTSPMYMLSYSLDGVVALELWRILQDDPLRAKEIYLNYLRNSTEHDFVKRLKNAGLSSPYEKQNLEELARYLDDLFSSEAYLNPKPLE